MPFSFNVSLIVSAKLKFLLRLASLRSFINLSISSEFSMFCWEYPSHSLGSFSRIPNIFPVDRRLLFILTFSSSILSILHSCQSNELDWSPDFFTKKQIVFIDRIFEIIIPETDTPGATSLNLSRFVDAYIYRNTPSDSQSELTKEIEE